jgi:hypothetical protein
VGQCQRRRERFQTSGDWKGIYLWIADGRGEAARREAGGLAWVPRRPRRREEVTARAKTLDRRTAGEAAIILS